MILTSCHYNVYDEEPCDGLIRVSRNYRKMGYTYSYYRGSDNPLMVIKCKYQNAMPFSGGYAFVEKFNKWGMIDINGENVIPFDYDNFISYSNSIAVMTQV